MKLVVNRRFGGFGLSDKAVEMVMNKKGLNCFRYVLENGEYIKCESFDNNWNTHYMNTHYMTEDLGNMLNIHELPSGVYWYDRSIDRDDPDLISVVEELGEEANGVYAELEVVEIPDDVNWEIDDYDGYETIEEVHRSW